MSTLAHACAFGLHLTATIVVSAIPDAKGFSTPLTYTGVAYNNTTQILYPDVYCAVEDFRPWALVAAFFAASALAESFQLFTRFMGYAVKRDIGSAAIVRSYTGNKTRWIEYTFGAPPMMVLISLLFGMYDITSLAFVAFTTAVTMVGGYQVEANTFPLSTDLAVYLGEEHQKVDWTPFWVGSALSVAGWAAVFTSVGTVTSEDVPAVVYITLVVFFIFYMSFPAHMLWGVGRLVRNPTVVEIQAYETRWLILSFTSKLALGILGLLSLTAQPNGGSIASKAQCALL